MTVRSENWSLPGAAGEPILVTSEAAAPVEQIRAVALMAHGFKGYKDYGFIPALAHRVVETLPVSVHRFNFSHSGMTNNVSTFERPDLFERDTWGKQVADLNTLADAVRNGAPESPSDRPLVLIGHSRGGAACLLMAGRRFRDGAAETPAAVITMAAPDRTMSLDDDSVQMMRRDGYLLSPSARTGQMLRQGRIWLDEQEAAPEDHDILALCAHIRCPVLVAHAEGDPTVPVQCAHRIAGACPAAELLVIPDGNHVFNTPNPYDPAAPMSATLTILCERIIDFIRRNVISSM